MVFYRVVKNLFLFLHLIHKEYAPGKGHIQFFIMFCLA